MIILLRLFAEFFKVGLFAVGGGLATLPFLYDLSSRSGWFTSQDIADMIAVAESTPGAIGVNMATFAGFMTSRTIGAVVATLGLITPSIVVILLVANLLENFHEKKIVQDAFYGLRPASIAMISASGVNVIAVTMVSFDKFRISGSFADLFVWKAIIFGVILYVAEKKLKWSPIAFIAISAAVGVIFNFAG